MHHVVPDSFVTIIEPASVSRLAMGGPEEDTADLIIRRFVNEAQARQLASEISPRAPADGGILLAQLEASSASLAAHVQLLQAQLLAEGDARAAQLREARHQASELADARDRIRQVESERWEALEKLAVSEQRLRDAEVAAVTKQLAHRARSNAEPTGPSLNSTEMEQLQAQMADLGLALEDLKYALGSRNAALAPGQLPYDDTVSLHHVACLEELQKLAASYFARHSGGGSTGMAALSLLTPHVTLSDAEVARHLQQQHQQLLRLVQHLAVGTQADAYT